MLESRYHNRHKQVIWCIMGKMIECVVDSIRVSLTNQDRITVLKEKDAERYLPIWMGIPEIDSITIALQGVAIARPITHDLMISILNALNIRLERCEITHLETDTFYANLILAQNHRQPSIRCDRPRRPRQSSGFRRRRYSRRGRHPPRGRASPGSTRRRLLRP